MKKILSDPTKFFPMPTVMISCRGKDEKYNITPVGYVGIVCWKPPIIAVGIAPQRHSNKLIKETMEFVINIPSTEQVKIVDYCGFVSGRDVDKFSEARLTPVKGEKISAPIIQECPVNIECKVKDIIPLGTHDLFLGEVVAIQVDESYGGNGIVTSVILLTRQYREVGNTIGVFGDSNGNPPVD